MLKLLKINGLALCLIFSSTFVFSSEKDEGFAKHKEMVLKEMGEQISILQKAKACMAGASEHDTMKKCHMTLEADREHLKNERKQMKEAELGARIQRLESEKRKLENSK